MKKLIFACAILAAFSFTQKQKKLKKLDGYVFVPSGSIEREGQQYSCAAFWMSDHEVTNGEYGFFLKHLLKEGRTDAYKKALPDTSAWTNIGGHLTSMRDHYLSHPAYMNYPVVNVSTEGVKLYCEYLTEQLKTIYGDQINPFRLPTRKEWMYAASGGNNRYIYSWGGPEMRNDKGDYLANFRRVGDYNITLTPEGPKVVEDSLRFSYPIDDNAYITAPSKSYYENEFGLYNMCGNVAELVADEKTVVGGDWHSPGYDIRIESKRKFTGPSPFVGFRPVMTFIQN
ncbi:MAG: SUMF1/EgtB/PvdO family nonheme iron enzyme [Crocinitomicaceae bacterium]|nr:SUMF1/EgtB/PvdO family nonheme iron enzyme [Crocinitomicaceae bacterium]